MNLQNNPNVSELSSVGICHIIVDLDVGGAEMMLKRLIESQCHNTKFRHCVITFKSVGMVGLAISSLGIEVMALNIRSFRDVPTAIWHLVCFLRASRPHIVQTWMYHADLIGGLAALLAGCKNIIWGIRSNLIPKRNFFTRIIVYLCAKTSFLIPRVIVSCAESARLRHISLGYKEEKIVVIPNGYDLAAFVPTPDLRKAMRLELGISKNAMVIGTVGRFDFLKDYKNFILAARIVAKSMPSIKFLMLGRNIDVSNSVLMNWIVETGFSERFLLCGERDDVSNCLAAMDIFCLPSLSEGFPNVVAEAMCMQLPCVVTDVGDSALIVRDTGLVVSPSNESALAEALLFICNLPVEKRVNLGRRAREVVVENYSITKIEQQYSNLYLSMV